MLSNLRDQQQIMGQCMYRLNLVAAHALHNQAAQIKLECIKDLHSIQLACNKILKQ